VFENPVGGALVQKMKRRVREIFGQAGEYPKTLHTTGFSQLLMMNFLSAEFIRRLETVGRTFQ